MESTKGFDHRFEVMPGKGIGPFILGITHEAASKILEEPYSCGIDEDGNTYYHYETGISLSFFDHNQQRLSAISANSTCLGSLWGRPANDLKIEDLHGFVAEHVLEYSWSKAKTEEGSLPGAVDVWPFGLGIDFHFDEHKQLDSISVGLVFGDDDKPIWPAEGNSRQES